MKVVQVTDFGVVANTEAVQTEQIQAAIDHVFSSGGGEVQIPTGVYYIGALRLRSGVCLRLLENAILLASRNPEDYFILNDDQIEPVDKSELDLGKSWNDIWTEGVQFSAGSHVWGDRWHNGIIRALHAENIAIIGEKGSVLDGGNCFDEKGEENYRGPHGTSIVDCRNVILKGFTVRHSGNWANMLRNCENIVMEDVTVEAGHDGIHLTTCDNAKVLRCKFYTGDDCVAGFDINNLLVEDCVLNSSCSALRLGGTNILVKNCHAYAPSRFLFRGGMTMEERREGIISNDATITEDAYNMEPNMLSFFTYLADNGAVIRNTPENIVIKDCVVEGPDRFLHFNFSGNEPWQNNRPLTQIAFENIKVTGISMPLTAYGSEEEPCDIAFKNVEFSFREGFEDIAFMHAANISHLSIKDVTFHNDTGNTFIKLWGEMMPETEMEAVQGIAAKEIIVKAKEPFVCKAI